MDRKWLTEGEQLTDINIYITFQDIMERVMTANIPAFQYIVAVIKKNKSFVFACLCQSVTGYCILVAL